MPALPSEGSRQLGDGARSTTSVGEGQTAAAAAAAGIKQDGSGVGEGEENYSDAGFEEEEVEEDAGCTRSALKEASKQESHGGDSNAEGKHRSERQSSSGGSGSDGSSTSGSRKRSSNGSGGSSSSSSSGGSASSKTSASSGSSSSSDASARSSGQTPRGSKAASDGGSAVEPPALQASGSNIGDGKGGSQIALVAANDSSRSVVAATAATLPSRESSSRSKPTVAFSSLKQLAAAGRGASHEAGSKASPKSRPPSAPAAPLSKSRSSNSILRSENSTALTAAPSAQGSAVAVVPDADGQTNGGGMVPGVPAADPLVRDYVLTVSLRSFQERRGQGDSPGAIIVRAVLPVEIIELVVRSQSSPRKSARTSFESRDEALGQDRAMRKGQSCVAFTCGAVPLAQRLASDLRVMVEVWCRHRSEIPALLGVASVPLAPLLYSYRADVVAPVYAPLPSAFSRRAVTLLESDSMQVGRLGVVLTLEDLGPAGAARSQAAVQSGSVAGGGGNVTHAPAAQRSAASVGGGMHRQGKGQGPDAQAIEAAGEREVWRREAARWQSELQQREAQRMALMEIEWQRRERAREAEAVALRAEYHALQERARQVLLAAEERERRLAAAEAALARRNSANGGRSRGQAVRWQ